MLMDLADLVRIHSLKIDGVLHLGAHTGEEARAYHRSRVGPVWWVEADPEVMPELTAHLALWPNQTAINACVDEVTGYQRTFHRANNHQSSSLLELGTHKEQAPDVHYVDEFPVITTKVDDLIFEYGVNANFLNMDLQGAELLALFGAEGFLTHADYIYSEVNWEPLYKECAIIHDMDEWLFDHGFTRYDTMMAGNSGWGDALWARPEALGL